MYPSLSSHKLFSILGISKKRNASFTKILFPQNGFIYLCDKGIITHFQNIVNIQNERNKKETPKRMSQKGEINVKDKKCWELFSIPEITSIKYEGNIEVIRLKFGCKKTNTCINVYCPKNENMDVDAISKIMRTALSVCHHCTGKKPLCDSGYIVC